MQIDRAWSDIASGGVHFAFAFAGNPAADLGDPALLDRKVSLERRQPRAVDDRPVADYQVIVAHDGSPVSPQCRSETAANIRTPPWWRSLLQSESRFKAGFNVHDLDAPSLSADVRSPAVITTGREAVP